MHRKILTLTSFIIFSSTCSLANADVITTPDPNKALSGLVSTGGFYLGVTGYWVVPSETGFGLFSDSWQYAQPNGDLTALSKPSKIGYRWAISGTIGYDVPCTADSYELTYMYLRNHKHNLNDTSDGPVAFGSLYFNVFLPLSPGEFLVSDSGLKYGLNQFDLTYGHRFTEIFGHVSLKPVVGVRYASLEHNLTFSDGFLESNYHGFGPMVGAQGTYDFGCGFGASAYFDTGMLVGVVRGASALVFGDSVTNYELPSINRVVESFNTRLGLDYAWNAFNTANVKFELGYQVTRYADVFDLVQGMSAPTERISNVTTNSFSYAGPYFTVTLHT